MRLREEELKIRRETQEANAKVQQAFTAQLLQQQQRQQNMFAALQKGQQMQASIMLQQQQSQAMMAIVQELVKNKWTVSYQEKSIDTCI